MAERDRVIRREAGMTVGRRWRTFGVLLAIGTLVAAVVGTGVGGGATDQGGPITIGWAYDTTGTMAPFDSAGCRSRKDPCQDDQREGRRSRAEDPDQDLRHAEQQPGRREVVRGEPARRRARRSSSRPATSTSRRPVVQEAINRGSARGRAVHRHRPDGPEALRRAKGRLAFSFGNVAQDEGSAMAEYAWRRGWRRRRLATNTLLVYFKNVVTAFEKRFRQLGGRIVAQESYATGANNVNAAVSRLNSADADVIVTSTALRRAAGVRRRPALARQQDADPQLVGRRRHLLAAEGPARDEYYAVTYASVFGDDPNAAVERDRSLKKAKRAGTGGFVTGARRSTASSTRSAGPAARRTALALASAARAASRRATLSAARSASRGSCTASSDASTA